MDEPQGQTGVKGQEGTGAGAEPGAATDGQPSAERAGEAGGAGQGTGTDEAGFKPSWRQQQAADRSGLSPEDVAGLVEAWGEERASGFLDKRADQHDSLSAQASQFGPQPAGQQPAGQQPAGQQPAGQQPAAGIPEGEFTLSPELFDKAWEQPEVVANFFKPFVDEANATRKMLRTIAGQLQEASDRTTAMTADMFFTSLGDEYKEAFGEGPTNVHSTEPQQQSRLRVIRSAEKIAEGFSKAGTPIHSREALERAFSMEMGANMGIVARNRAEARARQRAGQAQAGPRGRRQTKPQTRAQRRQEFVRGAGQILAGERYDRGRKP